jgi:ABC-2 type transport system ATP-binding protein
LAIYGQNKVDDYNGKKNFQRRNPKTKKYLRDLSKETRKVGIIATLIGNPEVIILDEPFANLDPHNSD